MRRKLLHSFVLTALIAVLVLSTASVAPAQLKMAGPIAFSNTVTGPISTRSLFPFLDGAEGSLDKVWADERAFVGSGEIIGVRIHVKFNVKKAIHDTCKVVASFFNAASNRMVAAAGSKAKPYTSDEGHVMVVKPFSPTSDDMNYPDMQIFIPYFAMKPEDTRAPISFFVSGTCGDTRFLSSKFVSVDPPPEVRKQK